MTALALGLLTSVPAHADTAPPVVSTPTTVAADVLPTVQINGVVWAQVVVGNTVYATGEFSSSRPAGSPAGTNETPVSNILAYDITTGAQLTSFAASLNASGQALAASSDGQTIFVGGNFTQADGVAGNHLVALDAATGAVKNIASGGTDSRVSSLTVLGDTLYVGGIFGVASGQPRTRLAAYSISSGALLPWAPTADADVMAMTAPANTGLIVVGGRFANLNGAANYGLGSLDAVSGAAGSFAANTIVRDAGQNAAIYSLTSSGGQVIGTGYVYGTGGNLENTFSADAATGALTWVSGCLGDTYDAAPINGVVYIVGHAHNCAPIGGFPEQPTRVWQRSLAYRLAPAPDGRTNLSGTFVGRPAPELLHFLPTLAAGSYTGQTQAAWSVVGNGQYLAYGGEFPSINGVAQQGLARLAIRTTAPNLEGPQGYANLTPALTTVAPGTVRASWTAAWDRDNERLNYALLRGPTLASATVVATSTFDNSAWWNQPSLGLLDRTAPPGSNQSYRIRVTDPVGNTVVGATATTTVPATSAPASYYQDGVAQDGPLKYWRLGEAGGSKAADFAGAGDLTLSGTTRGTAGALAGDPDAATTFAGSGSTPATTTGTAVFGPQAFSLEAWFKTTTDAGKIIGFGNASSGTSSVYDRQIYLSSTGQLTFGVSPGAVRTLTTSATYANGQWHHVVGTLDTSGMKLYVDGALVASRTDTVQAADYAGFWRIGGDAIGPSWPSRPKNVDFKGTLDDVAVYAKALSPARVTDHYQRGKGSVTNAAPTASFTANPTNMSVAFDGSASADTDGTISSYAWDFGDSNTGTGATPQHTYSAPGSYTVKLTVTDNGGASGTTSSVVTLSPAAQGSTFVSDAFGRTVANGFGTADTGGTWTVSGSGVGYSTDGSTGVMVVGVGKTGLAKLGSTANQNNDVTHSMMLDALPTGGGFTLSTIVRGTSGGDYRARVKILPTGEVQTSLSTVVNGTETVISPAVTVAGLTYAPGLKLAVHAQAAGASPTALQMRVWDASAAEPTTWQNNATDSTAGLQGFGTLGWVAYLSSTSTATLPVRVDDLVGRAL